MKKLAFLLGMLFSLTAISQIENKSTLSLEDIMRGEEFVGYQPDNIRWSMDNEQIFFEWGIDANGIPQNYQANIKSKTIDLLTSEQLREEPNMGIYSKDNKYIVYEKSGDIFLLNTSNLNKIQVTSTSDYEYHPVFTKNDKNIVYQKGDNLYAWSIEKGNITQLTDFRKDSEEKEEELSKHKQWLKDDQEDILYVLDQREKANERKKEWREEIDLYRPVETYRGDKDLGYVQVSPDQKYIVYQLVAKGNDTRTIVPHYSTTTGYTEDLNTRSKVGDEMDTYETWILNLETGNTYACSYENLEGVFDKPAYLKDYPEKLGASDKYEDPKEVNINSPIFSSDGKAVVNITSADFKDRWIALINLEDGSLKQVDHQHDEAWIGGPEIGWFSRGKMEWLDKDRIWFKSEKTGYAHLYVANVNTGDIRALTSGNFEILKTQLSKDKKTIYLTSNKKSPHEHHFYHLPVSGGEMKQITYEKGGHEISISPDEKHLAIRYSYTNKPWELYVMDNKPGVKMTKLTSSTSEAFRSYDWMDPEIVRFKASDGVEVPATLYQPKPENANGAAIIFVHGAGYLQNVHHWWPGYHREYMFHNFLVDNGYTVLAIDFRASAGYGRDWRTSIYRNMGGRDLDDQIDGADFLVKNYGIQEDKIGIYGGSYGGFITLMALFKYPGTFQCGAALRSVTDWAHYNHYYTANILNTPVEDTEAYKNSSPIYFAERLEDKLLMLHGMIDTNVHFQDVVRLSQRLIELEKENWELAVYPIEGHGFRSASSWLDEYRRIYELFEETLTD